jgi:uncharacterized protein DUF6580
MLAFVFVILAVVYRVAPHPTWWNFTPLAAALLFFGAKQPRTRIWIPLALAFAADLALNLFVYHYRVGPEILVSLAFYAGVLGLGSLLKHNPSMLRVVGASLTMSVGFFLISNFASWLSMVGVYPRSLAGLMDAYVAGIPFFRGTLAGDLFFSLVFFGIAAVVAHREAAHEHIAA